MEPKTLYKFIFIVIIFVAIILGVETREPSIMQNRLSYELGDDRIVDPSDVNVMESANVYFAGHKGNDYFEIAYISDEDTQKNLEHRIYLGNFNEQNYSPFANILKLIKEATTDTSNVWACEFGGYENKDVILTIEIQSKKLSEQINRYILNKDGSYSLFSFEKKEDGKASVNYVRN